MMKVLLIDIDAHRAGELEPLLRDSGLELIAWDDSHSDLYHLMEQLQPEVVIIDVNSPTRDTLEHVSALKAATPKPVLMLAKQQNAGVTRLAADIGVSIYVADVLSAELVQSLIDATIFHFHSHQTLKREVAALEKTLAERRFIERAKCLLMEKYGLAESRAYELMRKNAMNQRMTVADLARSMLEVSAKAETA